jgi:hypothetical protein
MMPSSTGSTVHAAFSMGALPMGVVHVLGNGAVAERADQDGIGPVGNRGCRGRVGHPE